MDKTCCLDCTERHLLCHKDCSKYLAFKQHIKQIKEKRMETARTYTSTISYRKDVTNKIKRRK